MTTEISAVTTAPVIFALGSYQALNQSKVIDHIVRLSKSSSSPNVLNVSSSDDDHGFRSTLFAEKGCAVKRCRPIAVRRFKEWADVIIYRCNDHVQSDDLMDIIQDRTVFCALPNVIPSNVIPVGTILVETLDDKKMDDLMTTHSSVIRIDDLSAFVIVGRNAMTVTGNKGSTCHVYIRTDTGETICGPLPTTWTEPVPIEEILQFPMPATASHLEALEDHVDTNFIIADDVLQQAAVEEEVCNTDESTFPKIVACGRTETLQMQAIVDKVVELAGTDLPKVLYIGTASFDRTDRYNVSTKKFRDMGCEIKRLDVSEQDTVPTMEEMKEMVEWAEVIMCSGGNTLHALLCWKEVGLDLLMKEASLKGVVLCGGSAGAGCWFSSLHTDSLRPDNTKNKEHVKSELNEEELADWDYTKISALGFVDAMCVPHFDATGTNGIKRSVHAEQMLKKDPSTLAIGVENDAALVIVGNEALAVSGDGKATCHVVVPDQETGDIKTSALCSKSNPVLVTTLLGWKDSNST